MSYSPETPMDDPEPTQRQRNAIAALSIADIERIDTSLLENGSGRWQKVAMVVARAMSQCRDSFEGIPDSFYAQRLRLLAERGHFESQGNLRFMRFSEVRIPADILTNGSACES